jgi:hypothetical protein
VTHRHSRPRNELPRADKRRDLAAEFFAELAQLLLDSGIGISEVQAWLLKGYVQAATKHAKFRNKNVNQSAVAAITGLTRPQVRALLGTRDAAPRRHSGPLENVINAWQTEPAFSMEGGVPKALRQRGGRTSFAALVKRFGSDIPARAMLAELERRRLVRVVDDHVHLNQVARESEAHGQELGRVLATLATALRPPDSARSGRRVRADYAELVFDELTPSSRTLFRRRVKQAISAVSADLGSAVAALEEENRRAKGGGSKRRRARMSKMSILVLEQD